MKNNLARNTFAFLIVLVFLFAFIFSGGFSGFLDKITGKSVDVTEDGDSVEGVSKVVCGDGECGYGETISNCPADCISPSVCGNDKCETGETISSCLEDCGPGQGEQSTTCGNDECEAGEDVTCPGDCGPGQGEQSTTCGNGECEDGETVETCSIDCVEIIDQVSVCGNNVCEHDESEELCLEDCEESDTQTSLCGNGFCELGENNYNCESDCPLSTVSRIENCYDSDSGKVYDIKGTVSYKGIHIDSCIGDVVLQEYFCTEGGHLGIDHFECMYQCYGGRCASIGAFSPVCEDSDEGLSYYKKGEIYLNDELYQKDFCGSTEAERGILREWYCDGDLPRSAPYECPEGCFEGVCIKEKGVFEGFFNFLKDLFS